MHPHFHLWLHFLHLHRLRAVQYALHGPAGQLHNKGIDFVSCDIGPSAEDKEPGLVWIAYSAREFGIYCGSTIEHQIISDDCRNFQSAMLAKHSMNQRIGKRCFSTPLYRKRRTRSSPDTITVSRFISCILAEKEAHISLLGHFLNPN